MHQEPGGRLATFDQLLNRRNLAATTRYRYRREIELAEAAGVNVLDADALADYAAGLPTSRKAFLKAAVGLIAGEMVQTAKTQATPGNVATMQAIVWRAEALKTAVTVTQKRGRRAHTWLNVAEVRALLALPPMNERGGLRDKVLLALLVGAGLRRAEAAGLQWSDIVQLDQRQALNVLGKGGKVRTVPISAALAALLAEWGDVTGTEGHVLRSVDQVGRVGEKISGQTVLDVVCKWGEKLGRPKLRPHDLRRTYARIGYDAGVDIGQISKLLGHASIATTQRYLGW